MSTNRSRSTYHVPESQMKRGPNGRKLCRWCEKETKPPRRTFCSDACVDEYTIRSNPGRARALVFKRDRGVCSVCELDTTKVWKDLQRFLSHFTHERATWSRWFRNKSSQKGEHGWSIQIEVLRSIGCSTERTSFWDMDHKKPVEDGGGGCGLENLQTLCIWCHKKKTADQAAAKAARRQAEKTKQIPLPE